MDLRREKSRQVESSFATFLAASATDDGGNCNSAIFSSFPFPRPSHAPPRLDPSSSHSFSPDVVLLLLQLQQKTRFPVLVSISQSSLPLLLLLLLLIPFWLAGCLSVASPDNIHHWGPFSSIHREDGEEELHRRPPRE